MAHPTDIPEALQIQLAMNAWEREKPTNIDIHDLVPIELFTWIHTPGRFQSRMSHTTQTEFVRILRLKYPETTQTYHQQHHPQVGQQQQHFPPPRRDHTLSQKAPFHEPAAFRAMPHALQNARILQTIQEHALQKHPKDADVIISMLFMWNHADLIEVVTNKETLESEIRVTKLMYDAVIEYQRLSSIQTSMAA